MCKFKQDEQGFYICPECNKKFSKHGIGSHYFLQHTEEGKKHKQKEHYANKGNRAWNTGKTKTTDKRLAKTSETLKEGYRTGRIIPSFLGKNMSEKTRQKISKKLQGNTNYKPHKSGRGYKGYYKGVFCSSGYELAWVIYNLDHNISFKRCNTFIEYELEGKKHKYFPDFELPDGTLVEIKGVQTDLVITKQKSSSIDSFNSFVLTRVLSVN